MSLEDTKVDGTMEDNPESETLDSHSSPRQSEEFPFTGIFSPGGLVSEFSELSANPDENDVNYTIIDSKSIYPAKDQKISLNSDDSLVLSLREIPPNEKVVTIDHILEQILNSLSTPDLLNYRLVSRRWKSFGAKELQKRLQLTFYDYNLGSSQTQSYNQSQNVEETRKKTLANLTSLLHYNNLYSDPGLFPCSKFILISTRNIMKNMRDEILQNFLSLHGFYIQELSLRFTTEHNSMLSENIVMEYIKTLIVNQAPNLRYLSLRLPSKVEWKQEENHVENNRVTRKPQSPLCQSDPEFHEIHSQLNTNIQQNTKLKVVKFQSGFILSAKVLELIIQLAPNLDRIIGNQHFYAYFLEPLNRLHLLKYLWFNAGDNGLEKFTYEKIAHTISAVKNNESVYGKLQLRHLTLLNTETIGRYSDRWSVDYERRVVWVINTIIESSWKTLETLRWDGVSFLPGMEFPEVLPAIWKLHLGSPHLFPEGRNIFPKEFNLAERFPKLRCVDLFYDGCAEDLNCQSFLDCLNFDPVLTVKSVSVSWRPVLDSHLKRIKELFPGATVVDYEAIISN